MKKLISILIVLIVSCSLFSQNEHPFAVAPAKLNIFYIGVDNPVDIAVFSVKQEDISVSITNGTIKSIGNGRYIVKVIRPGNAKITIKKNDRYLGYKEFRCKYVPDPVACIHSGTACLKSGSIRKDVLLIQNGVFAELDWDFDINFTVSQFTITVTKDEKTISEKSTSNKFTLKQKELIRNLRIGSQLLIDDIKCVGPDGAVRQLNTILLKIS